MKKIMLILLLSVLVKGVTAQDYIKVIGDQLIKKDIIFNGRFPLYTEGGKWIYSKGLNWFSGFTSGEHWYMYDITGNEEFKKRALTHADSLIQFATKDDTHDLGFIFYNSCVRAYQHTGIKKYRDAAILAARTLLQRFNSKGNFIRAWGSLQNTDRDGLMIIDTMMNLELLFWAANETGENAFRDIAFKHATTCLKEHIRDNYSSYHVVEFDANSGKVIKKKTHQGYADESTWARGQAWGIYGFALAYKYSGDKKFLSTSEKMTDYFNNNLPEDLVPRWDLDLKTDSVTRDASAGAIAASGMYLLSELVNSEKDQQKYLSRALAITKSLRDNYLFTNSKRQVEEGILLHIVYNHAKGWGVDESYPAGDFYFIECIRKELGVKQKK